MKKLLSVTCILALLFALAGCNFAPKPAASPSPELNKEQPVKPTPTAETPVESPVETETPSPVATPEPVTPSEEPAETLPSERNISISREGETEIFTGRLNVSERGYAIYLIDDFVLEPRDGYDVVCPSSDSGVMPEIYMEIYVVDSDTFISDDSATARVVAGDLTIDVEFYYPLEATEGGAVMLYAMFNTICAA